MEGGGDEKSGVEGGFRAILIPFETFAVLTPVETDFEYKEGKKLMEEKGK